MINRPITIAAVLLLLLENLAHAGMCGNDNIIFCLPMANIFSHNSERNLLEKNFNSLINKLDNDRATLLRNTLPVALRQISEGSGDMAVKFWVVAINWTNVQQSAKAFTLVTDDEVDFSINQTNDANCAIDHAICGNNPFLIESSNRLYEAMLSKLRHTDYTPDTVNIAVPPHSAIARGVVINDQDGGSARLVALLSRDASNRFRLDERDVYRFSVVTRKSD